jgi:hypothetical protein
MTAFALLLTSSLFGIPLSEAPAVCRFSPPQIQVVTKFDGPILDRSKSSSELADLLGTRHPDHVTQGLTVTKSFVRRDVSVAMSTMPDGQLCANIERINIELALDGPAMVYLASEIATGSCRDVTTIAHEQLHINHAFEAQQEAKAVLEAELTGALSRVLPIVAVNSDHAAKEAGRRLDRIVEELTLPSDQQRQQKDAAIDSPQSYRQLTVACP